MPLTGGPLDGERLIALAIPFFFLLIGIELLVARARRRQVYRLADAVGDLGCGMAQQVVLVFASAGLLAVYAWVWDHWRVVTLDAATAAPWLVSFVAVDFIYYWWHRASHRVNVLWAAHVVHHQSEDYNLAVALRQAVATSFTSLPFYLPMALLGVPPVVYATMNAISTLYQFWIHTELVGKLGPLEWVLNTPSHHRVHHAVNPQYLDKNYAATLIVWDRLFGTLAEEREPCVYGTVQPFGSFNAAWAQVAYWDGLWRKAATFPRWRDRLLLWVMPPPWAPPDTPHLPDPEVRGRAKYDRPLGPAMRWYVFLQFVPAVAATALALWYQATAPRWLLGGVALLVVWTLASLGGLLDGRRWAIAAEAGRVVAVVAMVAAVALA
jgi:sterol desaturase/sphingolipid hydroxylase (fatty acid hydroxylase superfamily)